jgi:hypothetical protein
LAVARQALAARPAEAVALPAEPPAVASPRPVAARALAVVVAAAVAATPPVAVALLQPPPFVSRVPRNPGSPSLKAELPGRIGGKSN